MPEACRPDALKLSQARELPATGEELRAAAHALGASDDALFLGNTFSEETIEKAGLSDFRIVYFATHGLLPHRLSCWKEPALYTSRPAGESGDGLLTAGEILELKLDADLVVLSACNTGAPGVETGGQSLSGLARSFFYAGARSMLVTHWSIPDVSTRRLMVATFENLAGRNHGAAEALRKSQSALMGNPRSAHPRNWGAFTLVGDGGGQVMMRPGAGTEVSQVLQMEGR